MIEIVEPGKASPCGGGGGGGLVVTFNDPRYGRCGSIQRYLTGPTIRFAAGQLQSHRCFSRVIARFQYRTIRRWCQQNSTLIFHRCIFCIRLVGFRLVVNLECLFCHVQHFDLTSHNYLSLRGRHLSRRYQQILPIADAKVIDILAVVDDKRIARVDDTILQANGELQFLRQIYRPKAVVKAFVLLQPNLFVGLILSELDRCRRRIAYNKSRHDGQLRLRVMQNALPDLLADGDRTSNRWPVADAQLARRHTRNVRRTVRVVFDVAFDWRSIDHRNHCQIAAIKDAHVDAELVEQSPFHVRVQRDTGVYIGEIDCAEFLGVANVLLHLQQVLL